MKIKSLLTFLIISILLLSNISIINAENTEELSKNNRLIDAYEKNMVKQNNIFDLKMRFLKFLSLSPGISVCAIKDDEVVWSNAYGYSSLYPERKASVDDIYAIGSISKVIMATAFMHIYERGMFDLDENINNYLPFNVSHPDYPDVNITVRMLLSHRSSINGVLLTLPGIFKYILQEPPEEDELGDWLKERASPEGAEFDENFWLDEEPGTKVTYSSAAHVVLVYLFKMITDESIESYCYDHIFEPLEMYNTSFHREDLNEDRVVTPYITKLGFIHIPIGVRDYGALAPVGGVLSTTEDLSHFLIMHMNNGVYKGKRILENETLELMHEPLYPEGTRSHWEHRQRLYGLDFYEQTWFGEKTIGHNGIQPGFLCNMYMNKTDGTGFIMFSNHFNILGYFQGLRLFAKFDVFYKVGELLLEKAREF